MKEKLSLKVFKMWSQSNESKVGDEEHFTEGFMLNGGSWEQAVRNNTNNKIPQWSVEALRIWVL